MLACTQIHVHMHMSGNVRVGGEWDAASWNLSPYHQVCHCWPVNSVHAEPVGMILVYLITKFHIPGFSGIAINPMLSVNFPQLPCGILHGEVLVIQYTYYLKLLSHKIPGPHSHFRTWYEISHHQNTFHTCVCL